MNHGALQRLCFRRCNASFVTYLDIVDGLTPGIHHQKRKIKILFGPPSVTYQ